MNLSLKNNRVYLEKAGTVWMHYAHFLFFLLLLVIFSFAVFEWKSMVFAPKDRTDELKKSILQSEKKSLDNVAFEKTLKQIEEYQAERPMVETSRDIFY